MKNQEKQRQILVTSALLYANGSLHLGHMVEAIQTDIWVRVNKLLGHQVFYICGSDAHGTPIMLKAREQKITPEELIAKMSKEHTHDFASFLVECDNFYTTHSAENKALTENVFVQLEENKHIEKRTIAQAYDPKENMFLPDRFIRGQCPKCKAPDQYGDNCEVCGASYSPEELIHPISVISGATPVQKATDHLFFKLENFRDLLKDYVSEKHLQSSIANKLKEWLAEPLRSWDISRDAPYFGFEIPKHPGKYFYVWLDAPIGYMASFENYCAAHPKNEFDHFWNKNSETELWHFIGKDIVYFHALFWPAMLQGANYRLPTRIHVHGYLTINGQKMSKSRGTFVTARDYLKTFEPEYLRYYFAAKLNSEVVDIDLNWQDFATRINADLINKYVNIASRCAGFISKHFDGKLSGHLDDETLFNELVSAKEKIVGYFEALEYNKAVRDIMALADRVNQYIDQQKPWSLAKANPQDPKVQAVCSQGLNCFKILSTYLKPILPKTAENIEEFLNCAELNFSNLAEPLLNHQINVFKPLMQRISNEDLAAFIVGLNSEK